MIYLHSFIFKGSETMKKINICGMFSIILVLVGFLFVILNKDYSFELALFCSIAGLILGIIGICTAHGEREKVSPILGTILSSVLFLWMMWVLVVVFIIIGAVGG